MRPRDALAWLALGVGWSCALPALRVDADLDEEADDGNQGGDAGDTTGGSAGGGGSGGKGGTAGGGGSSGKGGAMGIGGSSTGGKGGALTGGTGGTDPMCTNASCMPGEICVDGECVSCDEAGLENCSGNCRNVQTDLLNCGTCGEACTLGRSCVDGECECAAGLTLCDDGCRNVLGDFDNCGRCDTSCSSGQACVDGTCTTIPCTPLSGSAQRPLLDDFEDNDTAIEPLDGRVGYWWTYAASNAACSISPAPNTTGSTPLQLEVGGPTGSAYAAHITGRDCDWAGLGCNLHTSTQRSCPFDASAFSGVSFAYRSIQPLRVQIPLATTECQDAGPNCGNFHGVTVPPSANWTAAVVRFADLTQYSGGTVAFDPATILAIEFAEDSAEPFDYWIDNVQFTTN